MELEIEYVNHCEECDLGHAIYSCPKCNKVNIDYDDLWWNRDDNINVKCEICAQKFLLVHKGGKYQVIFKYDVESNKDKKLPPLSPKMLMLTNKNETDCKELEDFFNERCFEIDMLFIREFLCHKIEFKENLIMMTPKSSTKSYYLIIIIRNSMYYTLIEHENSRPSFQKWATFKNDLSAYYVGSLENLISALEKDDDPTPPMFPPEITIKNYRM